MPVGSEAFTGELGRQAGDGQREVERKRKENREAKKRDRDINREGERCPPTEKNRMRQKARDPEKDTERQKRDI